MRTIKLTKYGRFILVAMFLTTWLTNLQAQITELKDANTAYVHFYLRFADQAELTNFTLHYRIGDDGAKQAVSGEIVTIMHREFIKATVEAPYDPVNKCLTDYIVIKDGDIDWKEGVITFPQNDDNYMKFYGDAFLYVEQKHWLGILMRYDYVIVDEVMEQSVMYEYDPSTGLSTMLPIDDNGQCTWEINTQDFRHVGNRDYDMATYPYRTEVVLARKSAYRNWQYTIPEDNDAVYGDLQQRFGTDENLRHDDVFHASLTDGGNNSAVTFSTFREVAEEQDWPTGCTATRSCIVQSYQTTQDAFDGFVGHLKITLTGRSKKWKAESWVEYKNTHTDGWGTFCTPYDVAVPSGLLVLAVTDVIKTETTAEPGRIDMVSMADHPNIPAGTGVLVKGTGTYRFHPAVAGDQLEADRTAYTSSGNNMQYVALNQINNLAYAAGNYVLTYDATKKVPVFVPATVSTETGEWSETASAGRIPPFKSYLQISSSAVSGTTPGRELIGVMAGESSGVNMPEIQATTPVTVTDLTGRRYDATKHLPRGIYVVNGRKVFINN